MKYKIGDKVRVKSLEWYKKTLRKPSKLSWIDKSIGFFEGIRCGYRVFTDAMSKKFCGKVMTIQEVCATFYLMEEDKIGYEFTDEMIECLVEEGSEFQCAVAKAVHECLWGKDDEIPTEKIFDNDSVELGKNIMKEKISEYLLKYLPMTPDDKEAFVEEMNKNIL